MQNIKCWKLIQTSKTVNIQQATEKITSSSYKLLSEEEPKTLFKLCLLNFFAKK